MSGDEGTGHPHTLIVHAIHPSWMYPGDATWDYDLQHPPACKQEMHHHGYMHYTCDVAHWEEECGLEYAMKESGTPITEPGTYRIQGWWHRYHAPYYGTVEHNAGVALVYEEAGQ